MKKEDSQLQELQKITHELRLIKKDLEHDSAPFWKISFKEFGIGVIKGVGLAIGATIIGATIIYIIQLFIDFTPLADMF